MKKKNLVFTVIALALLSVGFFYGNKSIYHSGIEYSDLMLQNVEALSQIESGYGSSDCSYGPPIFSYVYSYFGEKEVTEHFYNGNDGSSGTDLCYTVEFVGCKASGSGSIRGDNYSYPVNNKNFREEKCKGPQGHKDFFS